VHIGQEPHSSHQVKQWSILIGLKERGALPEKLRVIAGKEPLNEAAIARSGKDPKKMMYRRQLAIIPSSEKRVPLTVPT
jgi:hypothetical protein